MVGSGPTMVTTSSGECEFKSGEGAWDITPTSTEGSRRANYPISEVWCSDNKYQCIDIEKSFNLDWFLCKKLYKFNWRASLVPAAAVIPAPIVYGDVVVVKKLVAKIAILSCYIADFLLPRINSLVFNASGCCILYIAVYP